MSRIQFFLINFKNDEKQFGAGHLYDVLTDSVTYKTQ